MSTLRRSIERLRAFFRGQQLDRELDEELNSHIELATEEHVRQGMALPEARRLARIQLGGLEPAKELHRDTRGLAWLDSFLQDLRYGIRSLRRSPGFTGVAVLSLALGIGANTAIFTMIESALLRPIAVKHADQLRLVTWRGVGGGWVAPNLGYASPTYGWIYDQEQEDHGYIHAEFAPAVYQHFVRNNSVFDSLFSFKELGRVTAMVDGNAEAVNCFVVSGDFYRGLEVSPVIGRTIGPADDVKTSEGSVAVISYEYWTRRFGRDPSVLGKTITLNQVPVTIIGVNPEYFTGVVLGGHFEIWTPLSLSGPIGGHSLLDEEKIWSMPLMGRLKPGVTDQQAQSAFDALFQRKIDADYSSGGIGWMLKDPAKRPHLTVVSGARGIDYVTPHYDRTLLALWCLAGLVLLVACANVANLLLARSAARQREISLRLALGASRMRVAGQLLAEGFPLAGLAGIAGIIVGYATRNIIPALLATPWRSNPLEASIDSKVLLVSLAITLLAALLFSLAPALQIRRVELNDALKDASRSTAGRSKLRVGHLLVVLQVALSILLLAGAGFCIKTFTNLRSMPLGMRPEGVMLFTLDPPRLRYPADRIASLMTTLQEKLNAIPGITSATFNSSGGGTLIQSSNQTRQIQVDSGSQQSAFNPRVTGVDIGDHFFETMGIPILYGRPIDARDSLKGPHAVVVNQQFGRSFFQRENPVGLTFIGSGDIQYEIVGVCADWRVDKFRDPIPASIYGAWLEAPRAGPITFTVKIEGDNSRVTQAIRENVRQVDSNLAITDVRTELEQIENGLSQERLMASLAAIFGGLALLLASIGIYGVMAYAVTRRTNEIGIRIALGARPTRVTWMVLRETMLLAAAGIAIGVPAVIALNPILDRAIAPTYRASFAYGMKPNDPLPMVIAVLVLASAGFIAGYLPGRRAAKIDPMIALRHD